MSSKSKIDPNRSFLSRYPSLTPSALAEVASDLGLSLSHGHSTEWFSNIVRYALVMGDVEEADGPDRASNSEIFKEAETLATLLARSREELRGSDDVQDLLLRYAADHAEPPEAASDCIREAQEEIGSLLAQLQRMEKKIKEASSELSGKTPQKPKWRSIEKKELRIERLYALAGVFELAFTRAPTANNWAPGGGDPRHKAPTEFMAFCQGVLALAEIEKATPDISAACKEACRLHRKEPMKFPVTVLRGT